ncbi:MAG: gamma-glutamyl-gamma-aminobutyrate hydrolase family protein [Candidatus Eisenbacteria bacterium]|nr:gamma-glutamyl-gamma-aminobutyrate hydrolase family protein [Candidatus Eisenbacteria bacterium]
MTRPLILLSCDHAVVGDPPRLSDLVNHAYVRAIERAGGAPVLLPALGAPWLADLMGRADGILLTGGRDYRRAGLHPAADYCRIERERRDFVLWRRLVGQHQAVLGICLGMQLMNLGSGGTLYQDLGTQFPGCRIHKGTHHAVRLTSESRLGQLMGPRVLVNSSHHQAVRRSAGAFRAVGWSLDGVIEAVEFPGDRFVAGVQWHPERMPESAAQRDLFAAFVRASGNGGQWT